MKFCQHEGCGRPVVAKGLCSQHYQASRRVPSGEKRGPKPRYSEDVRQKYGGAPHVTVRLEPELLQLVQEHGGSPWIRGLIESALQPKPPPPAMMADYETFHRRIQKVVAAAIREVKAAHGDVAQQAGSVGKRVAAQLWTDLVPPEVLLPASVSGDE